MTTINETYINALLADATYVGGLALPGTLGDKLKTRMTEPQATYINKNFSVVTQIESGLSSFDATVWRANNADGTSNPSGKLYLSMRGTQQLTDFLVDADLAVTGNARAQVTDMINWWFRISTPAGEQAKQIKALASLYVADASVPGQGLVSTSDLAAGIEVNGHSLGGYLATAFTRLFGAQAHVTHTSTFNSAGFAPGSEAVFNMLQPLVGIGLGLGRFPSQAEQSNYFAVNGLNMTTNSFYFNQQGQRVEISNESDATQVGNHYMYKLTDALALGAALEKLDTKFTMAKLDALLEVGSNKTAGSIEGVIDALRKALAGPNVEPMPIGDVSDSAPSRVTYHATLAALQTNPIFTDLQGQLKIEPTSQATGALARNDFGALIALQDLSPLLISGTTPAAQDKLTTIWQIARADDYTAWAADKSAATPSTFTNSWITDRATLLVALVARNSKDGDGVAYSAAMPIDRAYDLHWFNSSNTEQILIAENTARQGGVLTPIPVQRLSFGGTGNDTLDGTDNTFADHLYGGGGDDKLNGLGGNDHLEGGSGDDTLDGGDGNDTLLGGAGTDTYTFTGSFGQDTLTDSDGLGKIVLNGNTITSAKGAGQRDVWRADLADGSAANLRLLDDASSSTGKKLVITQGNDSTSSITLNNFNLTQAQATDGYLGIKLDNTPQLALVETSKTTALVQGGNSFWSQASAALSSLTGQASSILEGAGKTFTLYLNRAANTGDTITLHMAMDDASLAKAILGDSVVPADGAVIQLTAGQTQVSFALANNTPIEADHTGGLSASYQGTGTSTGTAQTANSNTWDITLKDTGTPDSTLNGDYLVKTGTWAGGTVTRINPEGQAIAVLKNGDTYYLKDPQGNLLTGSDTLITNNVIYGSAAIDKIDGGEGNDALSGGAGNDIIDGGAGDDMIGGGSGADTITGGAGDDYISSAANIEPGRQQYGPQDQWNLWGLPAGSTTQTSGATWGVYKTSTSITDKVFIWSGATPTNTNTASSEGDVIDAGAGNDQVIASWADDRIQGGDGNDNIHGLAGNDIIEGGAGDDFINADGLTQTGLLNSTDAASHGNDFIDGGEGADTLIGGGGADDIFGGAGDDRIWADGASQSSDASYVEPTYSGADYVDGEDGNDYIEGGAKDDTLYGGAGDDVLKGDTDASNLSAAQAQDQTNWGNDYLDGEDGNDLLWGNGGDDTLYGGAGNDQLIGDEDSTDLPAQAQGNDYLDGEDGNDLLMGNGGDDTLYGGEGNDLLVGDGVSADPTGALQGQDYLDGGAGDDTLFGGGKDDVLVGGAGNDFLRGDDSTDKLEGQFHGADVLDGGAGDDRLVGDGGADILSGGDGNDYLVGDQQGNDLAAQYHGDDDLDGGNGNDTLVGGGGNDVLMGGAGDDFLSGDDDLDSNVAGSYSGNDTIDGGDGNDSVIGGKGDDTISGGAGNDLLFGSQGDDVISGGVGEDWVVGGEGNDTLDGGAGNDQLFGGNGNDTISGGDGNDILNSGDGNDTLDGGLGNDVFGVLGTSGTKHIMDGGGVDRLILTWKNSDTYLDLGSLKLTNRATGQEVHIDGFDANDPLGSLSIEEFELLNDDGTPIVLSAAQLLARGRDVVGTPEADTIIGTGMVERINALGGDDVVFAGGGNDVVDGGAGNDYLDGGTGNDVLMGGEGDDTLDGGVGNDQLFGGAGDDVLLGSEGNDVLSSGDGNDMLSGGGGADTMTGATGNDTYVVDASGDVVIEMAGEGHDTVFSSVNYLLADNVEDLVLTGEGNINALGNDLDNVIMGNAGNNELAGGGGVNQLHGGAGDDRYYVYATDDVVVENLNEGHDKVDAFISYALTDNVEVLELHGGGQPLNGTGNALDNMLIGDASDNILDGLQGADIMRGGLGNDTYWVDNSADQVIESEVGPVGQVDTVNATASFTLGANVENLNLMGQGNINGTGNALNNIIVGNDGNNILIGGAGNDTLTGGAGADVMRGGAGEDVYFVDDVNDQVIEDVAGHVETYQYYDWWGRLMSYNSYVTDYEVVNASASFTLGAYLETLYLTGADNINGTGNGWDNSIYGNDGDNVISGMGGNDNLVGGGGNDQLFGGDGYDTLDGGAGNDVLSGGAGDDSYVVSEAGDVVVEAQGEGFDEVFASVDYTLTANVERLRMQDGAIAGTGNDTGSEIEGNDANNLIVGGTGDDVLDAGVGNDAVYGGDGNDVIQERRGSYGRSTNADMLDGGAGNDNIDGGEGNDRIYGGSGDDTLYGGNDSDGESRASMANRDTIDGGDGNDFINGGSDADVLLGGAGDDVIYGGNNRWSSAYEDPQTGEWIQMSNDDTVSGGDGNDQIDGQLGNDVLSGDGGDDVVNGGDGNDTIYGGTGNDILVGGMSYNYGGGEGNVVMDDDFISGGEGNDELSGGIGNDILIGGEGVDWVEGGQGEDALYSTHFAITGALPNTQDSTVSLDDLSGGEGDDVYFVDGVVYGKVTYTVLSDCGEPIAAERLSWTTDNVMEYGGEGYDVVYSNAGFTLSDNVEELRLIFDTTTLTTDPQYYADMVTYGQDGTGNALDNVIIGNALDNRLDGGAGIDTLVGGEGNDTYVSDDWRDIIVEQAGEGLDTVESSDGYWLENENLENLTLTGNASWGEGNERDNVLVANDAGVELYGDGGNDKLVGGAGNDWLEGGTGDDRYVFRRGGGWDVINDWRGSDTLFMGSDLTLQDLDLTRSDYDLIVSVRDTNDGVSILNWFDESEGVSRIEFCDGPSIDRDGINALFNAPPVANDDHFQTTEDSSQTVIAAADLLANDTDPNAGDALHVSGFDTVTAEGNAVSMDANGDLVYDISNDYQYLAEGETVEDSFTYTVADDAGASSSATVSMTIVGVNDSPETVDDTAAVSEDGQLQVAGNVLNNDSDVDTSNVLAVENAGVYQGQYGQLTLANDGAYNYQLDNSSRAVQALGEGVSASDVFDLVTSDGLVSVGSTLTVEVTGVNDAPVAVNDAASVSANTPVTTIAASTLLANDSDVDAGDVLHVSSFDTVSALGNTVSANTKGDLVLDIGNRYQPLAAGQTVQDSFNYTASDVAGATSSAKVNVTIVGVNDAPVAVNDAATVNEDSVLTLSASTLLSNDTDVDTGDTKTLTGVDATSTLGVNVALVNGQVVYDQGGRFNSLQANQTLSDSFAYTMADAAGAASSAKVNVTIVGVNDAPVAVNDAASVVEDSQPSITGSVLVNDTDVDANTVLSVLSPGIFTGQYGVLALLVNGNYSYTLDNTSKVQALAQGQTVNDSFAYTATDGIASSTAQLNIKITGENDGPKASVDVANVSEDGSTVATGNVLTNDSDIDVGDTLTVASPATLHGIYGDLTLGANGNYSYALNNSAANVQTLGRNAVVSDTFAYAVTDNSANPLQASASLTINISGTNDGPQATADTASVSEDSVGTATGNVLANDSDLDVGDTLSVANAATLTGQYGSLVLASNGGYTYTLNNSAANVQSLAQGQSVVDQFSYTATDGIANATQTLAVTVLGKNDAPILVTALADRSVTANQAISFALPAGSFTDIDQGDVLAYGAQVIDAQGVAQALPTWLTFNATTQTFSGTPIAAAALNIRVTAIDRVGALASDVFALTVQAQTPTPTPSGCGDGKEDDHKENESTSSSCGDDKEGKESKEGKDNDVHVVASNHTPQAMTDVANVQEDTVLTAKGNVLANDTDIDAGDTLSVANAATLTGQYGSLVLASNGGYTYTLNNSAANVQSLAQGQSVVDQFSYTATDGIANATQTLAVTVLGKNDAPILVTALADRSVTANQAISFALPAGSFTDIDQGDVLAYGAQVIDAQGVAQALPTWLTFNATTQTFSGTPIAAAALNIRVTAIDRVGALASDVFALTVQAQTPTPPPSGSGDGKDDDAHSVDDGRGHAKTHVLDGDNGADTLDAHKACSDDNAVLMRGGEGNDNLSGGAGDDILQGGAGNDVINGREGRAVLDGGAGNDSLTNGDGSGFFMGGTGNDTLTSGKGADLFAFNRGDGADTVNLTAQSSATDVLSLGKGIRYADIKLRKTSADLVVDMGQSDSITLKNWYGSSPLQTVGKLQVITVGGDYNASSSNKILNKQVEAFDFTKLVQKFDAERVVNASATSGWAVMNSLLDVHLQGSSTQALGGDLAFQFGTADSLAGMGLDASQANLSGGIDWQNLKTRSQLELGTVRLVS